MLAFLVSGRLLGAELKEEGMTYFTSFIAFLTSFVGFPDFENFLSPVGKSYLLVTVILFKITVMSLLVAQ